MTVFEILKNVANTSSKNEKKAILEANKDNEDLKEVIKSAYDPFINFYIRKIPDHKNIPAHAGRNTLKWAIESLDGLSSRKYTGNEGIDYLKNILYLISPEDSDIISRIIGRDLRCGFSESTANKIWPGLIFEYPCMLCATPDENVLSMMTFPAYFQMKLDGMRFNAIVKDNKVEYRSRNGKLIELFDILDYQFLDLLHWNGGGGGGEMVYDGELLIYSDNDTPMPRQISNGILQRAIKGKATKENLKGVTAVLWDWIPLKTFKMGFDMTPYQIRFDNLEYEWKEATTPDILLVESHIVNSMEEVQVLYKKYLAEGQEGGILKAMNAPWEDKRSYRQIKFKAELECDLLCVGYEFGTGKNADRLGALSLESSDGIIKVRVGSGFTDAHRDEYTANNTIGKIVSVKYNTRIKDKKTEQESLFLPIFIELRLDKSKADSSKTIK
jgi:hypothetical protein